MRHQDIFDFFRKNRELIRHTHNAFNENYDDQPIGIKARFQ